jgi:hypothetical protein
MSKLNSLNCDTGPIHLRLKQYKLFASVTYPTRRNWYENVTILCSAENSIGAKMPPTLFITGLRPNKGLSPRFEGIEVIGPPRAGVYPGHGSQTGLIDPPGVIVHSDQVGFLNTI